MPDPFAHYGVARPAGTYRIVTTPGGIIEGARSILRGTGYAGGRKVASGPPPPPPEGWEWLRDAAMAAREGRR